MTVRLDDVHLQALFRTVAMMVPDYVTWGQDVGGLTQVVLLGEDEIGKSWAWPARNADEIGFKSSPKMDRGHETVVFYNFFGTNSN